MTTHLIVPDSHAHPDFSNKRYDWLGKLIADVKPDVVINLGDMADMHSLCSYDKGTKGYDTRRYQDDLSAAQEASERLLAPLKRRKKKLPRLVLTLGNHEDRINRCIKYDSVMLDGTISTRDLGYEDQGWEVHPLSEPVIIDGIAYRHHHTAGIMDKPISGVNHARSMLMKGHMSCTVGHSHLYDTAEDMRFDGKRILALVAGCYVDYPNDWAGRAQERWWSGITIKRNVNDGVYDHQQVSLHSIRKEYSK
jgi:hypothetical protein